MGKNEPTNISLNWNEKTKSIRKNSFIIDEKNYVTRKLTINNQVSINLESINKLIIINNKVSIN